MKRMKKILPLLLGLVMVCFAFTGCSDSAAQIEEKAQESIREEDLESVSAYTENNFVNILQNATAEVMGEYIRSGYTVVNPTFDNDLYSRWSYFEELHGGVVDAELLDTQAESSLDGFESRILLTGEDEEQMTLTITYNEQVVPLSTTLTEYSDDTAQSVGSKMINAFGNIVVGLLVVFIVLILLMLVISCFGFIGKGAKPREVAKPAEKKASSAPAVAPAVAPVVAPASSAEDEKELIAVISAAIAAAEQTSPSGFVVRSIRRLDSNKWR